MKTSYRKIKNLFLRQSYMDAWEAYEDSLNKASHISWDYVILTAANEEQARAYREQLHWRLTQGYLPKGTHYAVLPDPDGKRVGSGGATFHVMKYIAEKEPVSVNPFVNRRILVIHSGGDSKRIPQYSAIGKLFSPVPRELPDGRASTLFDEFLIGMSGVPLRIKEGMLVLSGDVLLLFNPLQIDFQFCGAAAITIKEQTQVGKNHGVFLNDGNDFVGKFLHKQSEENLKKHGAVNEQGYVDLDTGAVLFDSQLLGALYGLICDEVGKILPEKYQRFVNEKARISFYGDFLYPLARSATLEQYMEEAAEGTINENLLACRRKIWEALHPFDLKMLCFSPAEFIHFGTTGELKKLLTEEISDYEFLDWKPQVLSAGAKERHCALHRAYIGKQAVLGEHTYIEDSVLLGYTRVGAGSIVSNVQICDRNIPENVVVHGLCMKNGHYVVRIYGVEDQPKETLEGSGVFLGIPLAGFLEKTGLKAEDLWEGASHSLWEARLFAESATLPEAIDQALALYRIAIGEADLAENRCFKEQERYSLQTSLVGADVAAIGLWRQGLENDILIQRFIERLAEGEYNETALEIFGKRGITEEIFKNLLREAEKLESRLKIRIYYALSVFMKKQNRSFQGQSYDALEARCFDEVQRMIYEAAKERLPRNLAYRICRKEVEVCLPLRVNWGGGWTDTPPHCNERGGVVLNAAIKLNGIYPVRVQVKRLEEHQVVFESRDVGAYGILRTTGEIQNCCNPFDPFALHKAALIACGVVPLKEGAELEKILERLGGGLYLSTEVQNVPKGSGLGTSSILAGACVKGLLSFLGKEVEENRIYEMVLCMEQIMSTGGGWQDQVGGLVPGIKFITTEPGVEQRLKVEQVTLREDTKRELQERFALIYTGQRRLARNLLRDVVGNYIGARPASVEALYKMQRVAALMRFELERGNLDEFAHLLTKHWNLSMQLDKGATNTCIDQILLACEDLIEGKFISGAGGGGFLQVILKKGVSRGRLKERIRAIFQESGVDVWDCEFVY